MPLFTVFMPCYNRAHTIHRVYESLQQQTLLDFEWLVVDDGPQTIRQQSLKPGRRRPPSRSTMFGRKMDTRRRLSIMG
ncbi:MAG: glycosyltransferase [Roseomonas sp.]|nr:glycosyltransferase [Roseomonas sp.]MCA3430411.1 glycosyltransferase [Roseomonas sp.]MCA3433814.1 glycosyltransferase [Roseomonas sp.]